MATPRSMAPLPRDDTTADAGRLILRLAVGGLMLLHGISKLRGGVDFIMDTVVKAGLPAAFGYGVYVGEVLAPLLVIIGLLTRASAAVIAFNMLVAIGLVHMGQLAQLNQAGGWELELQGIYLFSAVALALLGAGRYSVGGRNGLLN